MIKYTDADKTLVVPSGLGNFGQSSGSGGGVSPQQAAEIASAVTEAAIDEYDTEIQVDLEEIRDAVSGNSEDISTLSATTQDIAEQIGNLSGVTADISTLSAATSANTENIAALSAATEAISDSLANYATTATTDALSAVTSALTENLEALSAVTSGLTEAVAGKQDTLSAGGNIVISGDVISAGVYYDYGLVTGMTNSQRVELAAEMMSFSSQGKRVYIKEQVRDGFWYYELKYGNRASDYNDNIYFYPATLNYAIGEAQANINRAYVLKKRTGVFTETSINLPPASSSVRGGIIPSSGLSVDTNGKLSVKIGEGLAFSGDTLVASGGSGEQNYVIVNSLSEITEPYAGLEAYRREYTENILYTGYTIDASQIDENYAAHIYYDGQSEIPVYHNGGGFHWDWDNDSAGSLRTREDFYYTINSEHTIITLLFNNPDAYVTFEEGVTTATTSTTISTLHKAVTYRYNGAAWEEYQPPKSFYLDTMSQADLAALYTEISQYSEFTFPAGNYRFFVTNEGNDEYQGRFEVFVARFYGGGNVCFSGVMQSRYNNTLLQRGYELNGSGELYNNFNENNRLRFNFDNENFSWTGNVSVDLDNNLIKRGEDVLGSGVAYDSFGSRDSIVSMIQNGGRYEPVNGSFYMPQYKISLISSGVTKTYYKPVMCYEDITPVTIGGQEFSTRFTFIYTKEDGSSFKFSFMTNRDQYGADFQYQALS